jgi:hypothetical protein
MTTIAVLEEGTEPWYQNYVDIVNEINNHTTELTQARAGELSLDARLDGIPTVTQMQEYVQSVAMTGVDPSEIGTPDQIVTINATMNGFVGKTFNDVETNQSKKRKKLAKYQSILHLQSLHYS